MTRRIAPNDVAEAAAGLERLVDAVNAGELEASDAVLMRLEAGIAALRAITAPSGGVATRESPAGAPRPPATS